MAQSLTESVVDWTETINHLVTENDKPVDNLFSAKQQRLLTSALYSSWTPPLSEKQPEERRKFLADANVKVFSSPYQPPLVPDFFLSLDVEPHQDGPTVTDRCQIEPQNIGTVPPGASAPGSSHEGN
jgi:hypothetical protein